MSVDTDQTEAPVDGLDTEVQVAPTQLFHSIYAFFYNKRVGLLLILSASFLALLGVLFPQMSAETFRDEQARAAWVIQAQEDFGGWANVLDFLGLFHVFSSLPFLIVMGLLAVSILACTCHRIPLLTQAAFRPHTKVTAKFFEHARLHAAITSTKSAEESFNLVKADFAEHKFRVIVDERGPGLNAYHDKWHLAPFGTVIAHIAFVVIMAGFLVSSVTGFKDDAFTLTVGVPREVGHGTGVVAEAKSFTDSYYEDGTPKDYVTDLVLTQDGAEVARQEVRVNSPLIYQGVYYHQASFGVAGVIEVTDATGQVVFSNGVPLQWTTQDKMLSYGWTELSDLGLEVYVIGSASGATGTGIEPGQMRIEVYQIGSDEPLASELVDQGGSFETGGLKFTFQREAPYTGIMVKRDPGAPVVWIGCALLVIGTFSTMFLRHHRIWARVLSDEDGVRVLLASPDRKDPAFTRTFRALEARLASALSGSKKGKR